MSAAMTPSEVPGQMSFDDIKEAIQPGALLGIAENGPYREVLYVDDEYVAVKPLESEKYGWVYSHQYLAELAGKAAQR